MFRSLRRLVSDRLRRRYALKFRLVAVAVILVIAAIGGLTFVQTQDQLSQSTESQLEAAATAQGANLDAWIESLRTEATLLTETAQIQRGTVAEIDGHLDATINDSRLDPSVMAVHYLDASEPEILASSNAEFVGINPREQGVPWAQGGIDIGGGDPAVSDAFPGPRVNEPVIAVLAPIEERTDRVLVLMVNVGARADRLPEQSTDRFTRVVNGEGTIVMSHREDEILSQNTGSADEHSVGSEPIRRGLEGDSGYAERSQDNRTVVMGFAPVSGVDWVVTTRTTQAAAFAVPQFVSRSIGVLLVVTVLGFLLVGVTVGRPTARALGDLSETASAVAAGDPDVTVPDTNRIDELGAVQSAFRETTEYVATVTDQLRALAAQQFDAPVLDEQVPGPLGQAIEETRADLETAIADIEETRDDAIDAQRTAEEMATALDQQAQQFRAVMEQAADGDLTRRLDTDGRNDSMTAIAASTNEMLDELESTVTSVRSFATQVDESTDAICTSAEEVETTSQEVATTTQQIAEGADRQNDHLDRAFAEVSDLSATVEEIAASSKEVAEQSTKAADLGRDGCQQAKAAATEVSETADQVESVAEEVQQLETEMDRIGEIVHLIDDIAEQTNLLALNANIEAARAGAGDSGEGFAVVADEVKTLAEETSSRTDEIEQIITSVQTSTQRLVTDMQDAKERMLVGAREVEDTEAIFEDVVDLVEEANDGIHAIDQATDEQATATEQIVAMVDEVSEISGQTAEDTGDLAAAAEEQTASISSVTDQIVDLADRASRLRELTADFTVAAEATPDNGHE